MYGTAVNDIHPVLTRRERLQNLADENAKLRELCEDMLDCIEIRNAFERPPTTEMCEEFADRMRELGVEVD